MDHLAEIIILIVMFLVLFSGALIIYIKVGYRKIDKPNTKEKS